MTTAKKRNLKLVRDTYSESTGFCAERDPLVKRMTFEKKINNFHKKIGKWEHLEVENYFSR